MSVITASFMLIISSVSAGSNKKYAGSKNAPTSKSAVIKGKTRREKMRRARFCAGKFCAKLSMIRQNADAASEAAKLSSSRSASIKQITSRKYTVSLLHISDFAFFLLNKSFEFVKHL